MQGDFRAKQKKSFANGEAELTVWTLDYHVTLGNMELILLHVSGFILVWCRPFVKKKERERKEKEREEREKTERVKKDKMREENRNENR